MTNTYKVAAIQMVSEPGIDANLAMAGDLIAEAARAGAQLIALPEYFCQMGMAETDKVLCCEADGDGPAQAFLAAAAEKHGVWLVGGTVPMRCDDANRVRNSSMVYDPNGHRVARYDKIHLFGYQNEREQYREATTIEPGNQPTAVETPFGRLALSVCYDIRFPELYRALAPVDLITIPSAFTATTGQAHWELLVRSRAVENLAYVIAPAQGGKHLNGRRTHGHSMIVDPWGRILAERSEAGPGVVIAEIDPTYQAKVRTSLPALDHRVL